MRNNDRSVERGRFCCPAGSPVKDVFSPIVNPDGTMELVCTGSVNTDEEIESYRESCSLESILSRFANGDYSALNRYEPLYCDLTEFPKTYAEVLQHAINAENGFLALPTEVKQKYNNNWREWLAAAGTDSWFQDLGIDPVSRETKSAATPDQEVTTDES